MRALLITGLLLALVLGITWAVGERPAPIQGQTCRVHKGNVVCHE